MRGSGRHPREGDPQCGRHLAALAQPVGGQGTEEDDPDGHGGAQDGPRGREEHQLTPEPKGLDRGASMTWVAVIAASVWRLASSMALCVTVIWFAKVARAATNVARAHLVDGRSRTAGRTPG